MRIKRIRTNGRAEATGPLMHRMVQQYKSDMAPYAHYSLPEIFRFLKDLPYRYDPPQIETLMRPLYTINQQGYGGDCDDKAIAIAAWADLNGIPYRFVAVRKNNQPRLHHVFTELFVNGRWISADCTYNHNTLGCEQSYAEKVII